jgi:micrococcal nuclease
MARSKKKKNDNVSLYNYTCTLLRVVDGDTVDAMVDLGFNVQFKSRIRLYGVDTWEKRTRNKEEKKKGILASQYTKEFLEAEGTFILKSHGVGKYGRCLGTLWTNDYSKCLNEELKKEGHAYEYHGEKKRIFGAK